MINSRCPLPTGTRASSALIPVCIGSDTLWRGIIPGAFNSILLFSEDWIGPLPSIGFPKPSTTRPNNSFPTGTSTISPVRLTVSPSLIPVSSPKIETPTLSISRLRAIPLMPPGNSTISPACTWSRPYTRAIPSPTLSTVPTSATSALVSKLAIWSLITDDISAALISIMPPSLQF